MELNDLIKIIIISVIIIIAISFLTKKDNKIPISFEEKLNLTLNYIKSTHKDEIITVSWNKANII